MGKQHASTSSFSQCPFSLRSHFSVIDYLFLLVRSLFVCSMLANVSRDETLLQRLDTIADKKLTEIVEDDYSAHTLGMLEYVDNSYPSLCRTVRNAGERFNENGSEAWRTCGGNPSNKCHSCFYLHIPSRSHSPLFVTVGSTTFKSKCARRGLQHQN